MKRTLLLALIVILIMAFCVHISAQDSVGTVVTIDGVNIFFNVDSSLSEDEKQLIANDIVFGDSTIQTYGLICNLFGHKTTTEYVTSITHGVRATVPRCLEEHWEIIICSRCDSIIEKTRLSYGYKNCCPES